MIWRPVLFFLLTCPLLLPGQSESDYCRGLAAALGGTVEAPVTSGRVDILTATHAIEVDWAPKWKESIGQALWYGLQTNRRPGIILLLKGPEDRKYFIQLNSALAYAGLADKISTWVYPDDFPGVAPAGRPEPNYAVPATGPATVTDYWLSSNSNKRHRRTCRWYENSKGRYCTVGEGVAAGCCH